MRWATTLFFLLGSALLTRLLPFSPFFRNVNTMVHEFGHALVTLLLSGNVMYIYLYQDHSGVTLSSVQYGWTLIPVSLAGYTASSLFALYLFRCYRRGTIRQGMAVLTVIAAISLLLFVRNGFGVVWLIGFIALNALIMVFPSRTIATAYYVLLAFLTLEESVWSALQLLLIAWTEPSGAGDAANLTEVTGVSPVIWSALFVLFSLWCAKRAVHDFLNPKRSSQRSESPSWQKSL